MGRPIPTNIQFAIQAVEELNGDVVSITKTPRTLHKFGSRENVSTTEVTVMDLEGEAHEVMLASNGVTSIVSEAVGDTMDLVVTGFTIAAGLFTRVVQTVTMDGRTAVVLDIALARVERVENETGTELTGPLYVYQGGTITLGKPDTDSENHLIIPTTAHNQSEKAALTTADKEYIFLTTFGGSVLKKTAAVIDLELHIKASGGVWRRTARFSLSTSGSSAYDPILAPPLIILPNSDVRVTAIALTVSDVHVEAELAGYYGTA